MSILDRGTTSTTGKWEFNQTLNPDSNKPKSLISTNSNLYANSFILNFPVSQRVENAEVAVEKISLFRAWYNILSLYQNNLLQYSWKATAGRTTYTVGAALGASAIPDGSYQVSDLINYLQFDMHERGFYLVYIPTVGEDPTEFGPYPGSADDSDGTPFYFLNFIVNVTYYRTTIIATPVYASEAAANADGYYVPTAFKEQWHTLGWFSGEVPQLIIPTTSNPAGTYNTASLGSMSKVLGIAPGHYPDDGATLTIPYSANGQFAPQVATVTTVNVACNLVNNASVSRFANVIFSCNPNVVGNGDAFEPPIYERSYLPMTDGQYSQVQVNLYDDNLVPLPLNDPSVLITLSYRSRSPNFQSSPYAALPAGYGANLPQQVITSQAAVPINFGSNANQSHLRAQVRDDLEDEQERQGNVLSAYGEEVGQGLVLRKKRRQYGRI